jgi:alkylation response protein AidB-like acyl-CoA dehydrogenase
MAHTVTREGLLERVQRLAPVIREHADRGERERHLADPVVQVLQDAGLYRMLVPRTLGGLQVDPLTLYHVVEAVARVDGSTGWCLFINGCAPISTAFLRNEAAEAIYGQSAPTLLSGTVFPNGRAVPRPGGYLVSGRWAYASGCWHSTWHLAFCNIYADGSTQPRANPAGRPEVMVVHFPRAQMQILDTWDVSGLSATGSHDVVVEEVFVPDAFVWQMGPQAPRGPHFGDPLYRFPFPAFFSWPMAAVALGIAQRAIDEITEVSPHKTPRQATGTLHEQPLFHMQLAQAVALVHSARAWLHEVITTVWEKTVRSEEVSLAERATFLLAATNATRSAAAAVELAYAAGEGSANYRRSPLQRQLRDIHAVTQHVSTAPKQYAASARMLLGWPPDNPAILL